MIKYEWPLLVPDSEDIKYLSQNNQDYKIVGIDNLNSYYSKKYKLRRLKELSRYKNFKFIKIDLIKFKNLDKIFEKVQESQARRNTLLLCARLSPP